MGFFGRKQKVETNDGPVGAVTLSNGNNVEIAGRVDCLGDSCPRPQLMTKKALSGAEPQQVFEILIDNPSSMEAIPPMMPELNASHLETIKAERHWKVYVRKE